MQKKERGFTLVELLVSIVILGVLTTLMLPVINMSLSSSTNTSLLRYQTDTLEWYREIAKSKAIYLTTLSNEEKNTAVGKVNISYESKNVGNRTYVLVKPSLGTWLPAFYITPLKPEGITTQGIYVKILSPTDGESVENGSEVTVVVEAYYIENGNKETVDNLNITINGNPCSVSGSSNYTYQCTFTANGSDGDTISIVTEARKGSLSAIDSINITIRERSILVVNIVEPTNGAYITPGTLIVKVDSYLQTGNVKTPVEPNVSLENSQCTLIDGPGGNEGVTYTFSCNIPAEYGSQKTITAEASYGNLQKSDSVTVHITGYFNIVDITQTSNPNQTDEILPICITATYNYVVVKVDNGIAPLWNYIHADFNIANTTYTSQASNAYETNDGRYHYIYISIPSALKNNLIPGQIINIKAYINYNGIHFQDKIYISVCCQGFFRFSKSIANESKYLIMVTTGTVLYI